MLLSSPVQSVLVIAAHADDEVLGCGGLLAKLSAHKIPVHIMYLAVDGFHHYGLREPTTFEQRKREIEAVAQLLNCTYEIVFAGKGLIERLDTLPKRDLVDLFEAALNQYRPDLLLFPSSADYDQDHVAVARAAFAAARPIATVFGKWLAPHVMTYEMTQLAWAATPVPRPAAYCDITDQIETKLEAIRRYASQLRPSPYIRSLEAVRALACLRGKEIGVEYAEAFVVHRTIL